MPLVFDRLSWDLGLVGLVLAFFGGALFASPGAPLPGLAILVLGALVLQAAIVAWGAEYHAELMRGVLAGHAEHLTRLNREDAVLQRAIDETLAEPGPAPTPR